MTNLLLHVLNTLLLFGLLTRITGSLWRSSFVAALFAIHPVHVESAAWASERKDVLSALFWILTTWAYVRYVRHPGVLNYMTVIAAFALGLMAKPMLVTLPFVLLLLDYWPLGRLKLRKRERGRPEQDRGVWSLLWEKAPLFLLSAVSSTVTYLVQRKAGTVVLLEVFAPSVRAANALVAYASYIGKMLWPRNLAAYYPHPGNTLPGSEVAGAALLLACATFLVILAAGRRKYLAVGWLWYLGTLAPVIGLVQVGDQAMADRYTYIPLIGLFIIIAWGVPELAGWARAFTMTERERGNRDRPIPPAFCSPVLPLASVISLAALMACTWFQVGYWRGEDALWRRALAVTAGNYTAHNNYGAALERRGQIDRAIAHYEKALRIKPSLVAAYVNMGNALRLKHQTQQAIEQYEKAIRIKPDDVRAHYSLAVVLAGEGRINEAISRYYSVLQAEPDHATAHYNLACILARQGKTDEAIAHYSRVLQIEPDAADVHYVLANLLARTGKPDEAIAHYRQALRVKPDYAEAHYNLGVVLARRQAIAEAVAQYRQAIRIRPNYAKAHKNLAVALYLQGKYSEAWKEVVLCQKYGGRPNPGFIEALAHKLPKPPPQKSPEQPGDFGRPRPAAD